MEKIMLKPGSPGLVVRDPVSKKPLKEEGEMKEMSSYWARRIECGDAKVVAEAAKAPASKASK